MFGDQMTGPRTPPQYTVVRNCYASPVGCQEGVGSCRVPKEEELNVGVKIISLTSSLTHGAVLSPGDPAGREVPSLHHPYKSLGIS